MRRTEKYRLDQNDTRVVQLLSDLGMPKNLAKILMYLSHVEECYSADIEHGTNLRQPELSNAMRELRRIGLVKKRECKKKGKGRPRHFYKSTAHLSKILSVPLQLTI